MGTCHTKVEEVRFVIKEELTECYVAVKVWGDCPLGVQGWHHKTFPSSLPIDKILPILADDHLLWSLEAPNE